MAREFFTAVNLHGNPVKGVPLPVDGTDAANKDYVDARASGGLDQATADDLYVNVTGDTVTGDLILDNGTQQTTLNAGGLEVLGESSILHVESEGWLLLQGNVIAINGAISMSDNTVQNVGEPVEGSDAATKQYVDGLIGTHTHADTVSFQWTYDSVGTMSDPGFGKVRTDTAAGVPSTQIAFSDITEYGIDASGTLASLTVGDVIAFQQTNNASNWGRYRITAAPTDNSTWWLVPVAVVEMHGTAIAKNQDVLVRFTYGTGGGGGGTGGLTEVEIDALFLRPTEILAGTNITVTPGPPAGAVTISSTGGGASTSDVSGRWTFSTNSTATPPYAGAIWVANPSGLYGGNRLMVTGVDAAGTNHDIGFDFLRPGDTFFLQKGVNWTDGDGASYTIRHRSVTFNATYNTNVYAFGVVRPSTDNFIPATHTNGQPVRLYWFHNRKYGPGDYLLNENDNGGTSPDRGMIRFNGNPYYGSLASLTMMYVSENDLAGHLSYLMLYNLVSGNQMRLSLGQGGEILLTCSGTVVYNTDAPSGQYTFRIPVTVTSRTGYLGQVARLEVIRGGGGGSAVTAGAGLTQTGSAFDVVGDANLSVAADQVSVLSAPKWTTARTLALTGDVTGSVNIDGSANASLATTLVGGLTAATADALFLKPSEILAGSNVSVSTAGGAVTISSTGGGGGGGYTRATASKTTASLAAGAYEQTTVAMANGYRVYDLTCSAPARVRIYTDPTKQAADAGRATGTYPTGDHGLVIEFIATSGLLTFDLSPALDGFDGKSTPDGMIPITITNMGVSPAAIQVQMSWLRTE